MGTVLLVLLSSGLCSGSEAALFSVPLVRARQLAEDGRRGGKALLSVRENMGRPIATIVVLNNIANIVGSIAVGAMAAQVLGNQWIGLFSGVLTFMVILFAEIIPKTLGERHCERFGLVLAPPVLWITRLLTPLVWAIEKITALVVRGDTGPTTNEGEIKLLARIGKQEGVLEETESEIVERAFHLNDQLASDIMTPRVALTYLKGERTLEASRDRLLSSQHSRLVVIGDDMDDVLGVALKDELLCALVEGRGETPVRELMRKARYVPDRTRGDALLQHFLSSRDHLAIVADEFGGVAGVVTLEDVLETITGEIVDETDLVVDLQAAARSTAPRPNGEG